MNGLTLPRNEFTYSQLESNIKVFFKNKANYKRPWVSIEADGWTSNKNYECICVTVNFVNRHLQKIALPVYFGETESKTKHDLTKLLRSVASDMNMTGFISAWCTDNTANVLGSSDPFSKETVFQSYSLHTGCAIHQIQIFAKMMIIDITNILKDYGKTTFLDKNDMETDIEDRTSNFPLGGTPSILSKLVTLSGKIRCHNNLRNVFLQHVHSLPPSFSNTRWDIMFYLLKHFIQNYSAYSTFSKIFLGVKEAYQFNCSEDDYKIAKILYEVLLPFEPMTKLLSEKGALSICYLPLLLFVKDVADTCAHELGIYLEEIVVFSKFNDRYVKYYSRAMKNKYIHYASSLFHFDSDEVLKEGRKLYLEPVDVIRDIAFDILKLEICDEQSGNRKKRKLTPFKKFDFDRKDTSNQDMPMSSEFDYFPPITDLNEKNRAVLYNIVQQELRQFNIYRSECYEEVLNECAEKLGITITLNGEEVTIENNNQHTDILLKSVAQTKEKLFLLKTEFSLTVIERYLKTIKNGKMTTTIGSHCILPVVLRYLLSINITSVNSQRNFSALKRLFNDDRHSLDDENAGNELLVVKTVKSLGI